MAQSTNSPLFQLFKKNLNAALEETARGNYQQALVCMLKAAYTAGASDEAGAQKAAAELVHRDIPDYIEKFNVINMDDVDMGDDWEQEISDAVANSGPVTPGSNADKIRRVVAAAVAIKDANALIDRATGQAA